MKRSLVLICSLAALSLGAQAQQNGTDAAKADRQAQPPAPILKKLSAVTWDLEAHKLRWTVQRGNSVDGKFVPFEEVRYEIAPDDATMSFGEESRDFDGAEAASLHQLLDVLSLYCAESVVWWDQGPDQPLPSKDAKPGSKVDPKGVKVVWRRKI